MFPEPTASSDRPVDFRPMWDQMYAEVDRRIAAALARPEVLDALASAIWERIRDDLKAAQRAGGTEP